MNIKYFTTKTKFLLAITLLFQLLRKKYKTQSKTQEKKFMSTRLHTSGWENTDKISNCIIEKKRKYLRNYKLKKIIYKREAY